MGNQFSKSFLDHVCDYEDQIKTLFYFSVAVTLLMLVSLVALEPGSATFVIAVVDAAGAAALAIFSGLLVYRCRS